MTTFATTRGYLAQARTQRETSSRKLTKLREKLKSVERALRELSRTEDVNDPAYVQRRQTLETEASGLRTDIDNERQTLALHSNAAKGYIRDLATLKDPSLLIEELDDQTPILLFPLRIETRFKTVTVGGVNQKQLWIRVYPDDCQVDSFEEMLSASEVDSAQTFWVEMWKAGGFEPDERGAWRMLVASSGSGRAGWIVESYAPQNLQQKPVKANAQDVVLVIIPRVSSLSSNDKAAAFAYWIAVWKAAGDPTAEATALTTLQTAVGATAADLIIEKFAPQNLNQDPPKPYTRANVNVTCATLELNLSQPPATKTASWTQAPKVRALPERFVVMAYSSNGNVNRVVGEPIPDGLAAGPDPSLPDSEQIHVDDDELVLNEDLRWMVDFDKAVDVGMGFRMDLSPAEATNGFDRIIVLGVRMSTDETEGRALLEELLANHHRSRHGLGLVPQGSPTNNTEGEGAAYTWIDDPDASFDVVFKNKEALVESNNPYERPDGAWLAEHLGIDLDLFKNVAHAGGRDQAEARAMNAALWPATFGYFMEEMMRPTFSATDIRATRRFFTRHVSGRGPTPALRIGRQPYGILPVTAFSLFQASASSPSPLTAAYLGDLYDVLKHMDAQWADLTGDVKHVGMTVPSDPLDPDPLEPHKILLDILGLHSGSVEYHQRYAESFKQIYNKLVLVFGSGPGNDIANKLAARGIDILTAVGHGNTNAKLPILEKFFFGKHALLKGPVVDDVPLSESVPVRAYTGNAKNYLSWLTGSPFDKIRTQDFGKDASGDPKPAPNALLYLFLRHALMLSQWDAAIRILEANNLVTADIRHEPTFIHIDQRVGPVSKFLHLVETFPQITGDNVTTLADYLYRPLVLSGSTHTADLLDCLQAISSLEMTPTARLERAFAEHIDCASYRLDAWKTGLAAYRLEEMRRPNPGSPSTLAKGIFLGAYGWLEDVRPKNQTLTQPQLSPELAAVFQKPGQAPLKVDSTNAGYIHAPSINHAATAAILKNAYQVNASPTKQDVMAVNLSSERVRNALSILEGMRNGQTLSALLGYRFERGLHEQHGASEVDKFIYAFRRAFPLVADKLASTMSDGETDIGLLEARNVLDGVRFVKHIREHNTQTYPFGFPAGKLPHAEPDQGDAINASVDALLDLHDAVSDLLLAESVYQTVGGNFERAAANLEVLGKGKHPPEPEVVVTPRSGRAITHRVALHLDSTTDATTSPITVAMTPRARAEAPLNSWLAARMPDPSDVACLVTYMTPALTEEKTVTVTQKALGLQPIDLLYIMSLGNDQATAELDGRIMHHVRHQVSFDPHPALDAHMHYTQPVQGKVTFFELAPLITSLRAIILKSRYIRPSDMTLPIEAESIAHTYDHEELRYRISEAKDALATLHGELTTLETSTLDLDEYAFSVSDTLSRIALHGVPQTGVGDILMTIRDIYNAIVAKLQELVTRWEARQAEYNTLMATWPNLVTDEERFAMLQQAEALIVANTTAVLPSDPNSYKSSISLKAAIFNSRLLHRKQLLTKDSVKLVHFLADVDAAAVSMPTNDVVPFDIEAQRQAMTTFRDELVTRVARLKDDLAARTSGANAALNEADTIDDPDGRVQRMLEGARLVLGDEIKLLPRFLLGSVQGAELSNCWSAKSTLLTDLVNTQRRRFPMDDWMYGLARVREKFAHWENAAVLIDAFGGANLSFIPLQLPYRDDDRWVGLEIPDGYDFDGERLLYTVDLTNSFDASALQCGLLLDEWTEVIPAKEEMTGLTFHFDQPNAEPPQVMLLAVPPKLTGSWKWDNLTATLNETLDNAKKRAVEPAQVGDTKYAQFLPSAVMAVTLYQITIATNLAFNNDNYNQIGS